MLKPSTLKYQILLICFSAGLAAQAAWAVKQICVRPGSYDTMAAKAIRRASALPVVIGDAEGCYVGVNLDSYHAAFHIFATDADGRMLYDEFASSPQAALDGFVKFARRPGGLEGAVKAKAGSPSPDALMNKALASQVTEADVLDALIKANKAQQRLEQFQRAQQAIANNQPVPPGNYSLSQALTLTLMAAGQGAANALKTAYQCPPHCGNGYSSVYLGYVNSVSGDIVKLDDGSIWRVDALDVLTVSDWSGDKVVADPNGGVLLDVSTNEKVEADEQ